MFQVLHEHALAMQCCPRLAASTTAANVRMLDLDQPRKQLDPIDGASIVVEFGVAAGQPSRLVCDGPVPVEGRGGRSQPKILLGAVASPGYPNSLDSPELKLSFHATDTEGMRCTGPAVSDFLEKELRECKWVVEWEDRHFKVPADIAAQHAVRTSFSSHTLPPTPRTGWAAGTSMSVHAASGVMGKARVLCAALQSST